MLPSRTLYYHQPKNCEKSALYILTVFGTKISLCLVAQLLQEQINDGKEKYEESLAGQLLKLILIPSQFSF
jgi:hypothetical protein